MHCREQKAHIVVRDDSSYALSNGGFTFSRSAYVKDGIKSNAPLRFMYRIAHAFAASFHKDRQDEGWKDRLDELGRRIVSVSQEENEEEVSFERCEAAHRQYKLEKELTSFIKTANHGPLSKKKIVL